MKLLKFCQYRDVSSSLKDRYGLNTDNIVMVSLVMAAGVSS